MPELRTSADPIIVADSLTKVYRVFQKREGIVGALRGLFHRTFRDVRAVDGVSFRIEPGEPAIPFRVSCQINSQL
jgi:ABC-type uncharacterized transport system ATPase subunit